jgi:TolB-like protein
MADIFISYAREDRGHIDRLAAQLQLAGLTCWWDKQLAAGDRYLGRTETELNAARAVLVVWTRHSVGSAWVADEAGVGRESGRIVPISLDGSQPPLGFRQFHVLDFAPWIAGDSVPLKELVTTISRSAPETEADPAKVVIEASTPDWWRRLSQAQMAVGAAAVAALVLLVAAFALWQPGGRTRALEPSIAVLPFANMTGDSAKDYLAHGIASELIEALSQIDKLKVVGRGSSFSYKPDADPRKVGPALNVANVLSGAVSRDGDGVRISFELADASSGRTILSRTYTAANTTDNIASAQRYVAEQVAGALSIAFDIRGGRQLLGAGTRSLEAYDYYLQGREGRAATGLGVVGTVQSQSEGLFAKAVAADPNYGAAWGLMAIAHGSKSWNRPTPAESRAEQDAAYAMAKKAVTLDPDASTSQAVFANLSTTQHNWRDAETASLLALDLSVNEIALGQRQMILLRAGRVSEADALYRALEEVAPHAGNGAAKYTVLSALGRLKDLRAMVDSPDWKQADSVRMQVARLEALIDLGGPANEVRDALETIARQPDRTLSEFAKAVLAVFGDKEKARRELRTWYEGPGFENALKYELIPFLAAWYGDTELVLRVWRDDLPVNVVRMTQVWGPAYGPARSSPSFKTLMQDMGLVDYWRRYGWANKCRPVGASDFECG